MQSRRTATLRVSEGVDSTPSRQAGAGGNGLEAGRKSAPCRHLVQQLTSLPALYCGANHTPQCASLTADDFLAHEEEGGDDGIGADPGKSRFCSR